MTALFDRLATDVSGPVMMRHMDVFARWTKHAGTPEERESLRYIQQEMNGYGFRTTWLDHDAYISLPGKAKVEAAGRELRCITHSFSRSSPPGGVRGTLVPVGGGGEADFAAVDVRGRIVLVDGIASPAVSLRASRAGAVGQVHVSPHEHLHEMCISNVWGSPTDEQVGNLPSTVVVTISAEDGAALRRAGNQEITLHAEVDTGWRMTPILIADMDGPAGGHEEPFVLYSGHHDTWYYGVMDNGGANATMMEVARLCATQRAEWRRGLRVAFWSGHSQGRYSGSTWYADAHWEELDRRCVAHVNVDSTGGQNNTVVADTGTASELAALAREAVRVQAGQEMSGRRMSRAGDESFWGIGVPAMFGNMGEQPATGAANASAAVFGTGARLGHGTGWWWHTPDDLLDKIDAAILVRDTRIYLHAVWRLVADEVLPLDWEDHAEYLLKELASIGQALATAPEHGFDLSGLVSRAEALRDNAARLKRCPGPSARINAALVAVARALVPVDYSTGDRFGQDPALPQQAYPPLQPLRKLATLPAGSDEAKFLTVRMMRARNRVAAALAQANAAIEACLGECA
jgi:N-acetylated-alpha-linked acidic dipeptidase